uniref:Uncharacterized protein n=1 Tax=Panagrolaimus davidi TaxID=227884 RepID=A0A914PQX6_9BILA
MLEKCNPFERWTIQGVTFFSSTEFWQFVIEVEDPTVNQLGIIDPTINQPHYKFLRRKTENIQPFEHLFLTCHCSDTKEAYFFFPASLKVDGRNASNGIALCVRSYKGTIQGTCFVNETAKCQFDEEYYKQIQISGINNTKDVYDLMAYKYATMFHRNIISANNFSDKFKFTCLDIYGKPTRTFDGIESCAIQYLYNSSKGNDYVFKYSGPLLYGNLEYLPDDFLNTSDTAAQFEVNKPWANFISTYIKNLRHPIRKLDSQYCYFHKNGTTFYSYTCVCHGEKQNNCQIPKDKRICAYDMLINNAKASVMKDIWIKEQCEYYFISESEENVSISIPNFELFTIFFSNTPCDHYQAKEWCSKNRENFYETYKACCNETDFCNKMMVHRLKKEKDDMMRSPFKCKYAAKGIAILYGTCELYLDLMTKNLVVLNVYVFPEMNRITASKENCSYVIGTLQVEDDKNCSTRLYDTPGTVHSFFKCHCSTKECDAENQDMAKEMYTAKFHDQFYCQTLKYSINNSEYKPFESHVLKSVKNGTGVLCFIEISKINDTYIINAKAIQDNSSIPTICKKPLFSPQSLTETIQETMKCCTAISQHPQSSSNCTIKIMLQKFQKELENQNEQKRLIGQEGNLQCGKKMCFISDGCFETRELTAVKKRKMIDEKATNSSECVNKIDEKVLSERQTISTADYGYVCKLMESKDRCIVVYPPESNSKPLIVCCCNNHYKILSKDDETFQCPSKLEELPSQVGKKIGSFN